MARRMISTDISLSETVEYCSEWTQLVWDRLIAHQDDWGRLMGEPARLKARIKPLSKRSPTHFERAVTELSRRGLICWYEANGAKYIALKPDSCEEYQTGVHAKAVDRGRQSKSPPPPLDEFRWPEDGTVQDKPGQSKLIPLNLTQPNLTEPNPTKPNAMKPNPGQAGTGNAEQAVAMQAAIDAYYQRLQRHTGAAKPEFNGGQAAKFFTRRLIAGDTAEDLQAAVAYFFESYIQPKSAANFSLFQRAYNHILSVLCEAKP